MQENSNEVAPETTSEPDLDTIANEFFGEESTSEETEAETQGSEEQTGAEATNSEEAEVPDTTSIEPPEPLESEALALLADREEKLRQAKKQFEAEQEQTRQQVQDQIKQEFARMLANDPAGFLEQMGLTDRAGDLAMHLYAVELGDDAPPELLEKTAKSGELRELRETKARLEQLEQAQQQMLAQFEARQILGEYQAYVENVSPDEYPYLSKEDPSELIQRLADFGDAIYEQRGRYPSAAEVAKIAEAQVAKVVNKYLPQSTAETKPLEQAANKTQPVTISDDLSDKSRNEPSYEEDEEAHIQNVISEWVVQTQRK